MLTRPAIERDALLGYQDVPFAALVIGAVLLEARRPRRGVPVLVAARRSPGCCGRRRGCCRASTCSVPVARRDAARARDARRAGRRRAGDLGADGPARHRRPAALAARHGRPRRGGGPPPQGHAGAVLDRAVLRLHAARAARSSACRSGWCSRGCHRRRQAVLPLAVVVAMVAVFAIGPIFGLPLIGRYVAHAGRAADAVLRARRRAAGCCSPQGRAPHALDVRRRRRRGAAVGRLPALARRRCCAACTRASSARARSTATCAPSREAPRRARRVRRLRAADRRRPPADPVPALLAATATRARVDTVEKRHEPDRAACCCCRAGRRRRSRFYGVELPARHAAARATCRSTRTASWRVFAAPGCAYTSSIVTRVLADLEELRVGVDHRVGLVPHPQLALVASRSPGRRAPRSCRARGETSTIVRSSPHSSRILLERLAAEARVADRQRLVDQQDVRVHVHGDREARAARTCPTSRSASACP